VGDGDFVESILKAAKEQMERKYDLRARGFNLAEVAVRLAEVLGVAQKKVWAAGRHKEVIQARSLMCYWAIKELGITMISRSRRLDLSITVVSKAVMRSEKLAKSNQYSLIDI
jgi:putative transposase